MVATCYNVSNTKGNTMSGFITKVEVEANESFIRETWGNEFYEACLLAEGETFLSLLMKHNIL